MKKLVFVLIALVFVLSACAKVPAPTTTAEPAAVVVAVESTVAPTAEPTMPAGGITIEEMMEKYDLKTNYSDIADTWRKKISFKIVEPYVEGSNFQKVLIDGVPETIIYDENVYLGGGEYVLHSHRNFTGKIWICGYDTIFSDWCADEVDIEYYVAPLSSVSFALIPMELDVEVVDDVMSWEGTEAMIHVWPVSNAGYCVYENLTTKEVLLTPDCRNIMLYGDGGHIYFMQTDDWMWGYVHIETSSSYDYAKLLYISQSKPDTEKLAVALSKAREYWPDYDFGGPVDACEWLQSTESKYAFLEEIRATAKQYCSVYYYLGD